MKRLTLMLAFVLGILTVNGQDFLKKSKVSGSFQVDGNYYWEDNGIGITKDDINGEEFGAYGFGKLQYQLGNFTAGFRFEAYQTTPILGSLLHRPDHLLVGEVRCLEEDLLLRFPD